MNTSFGPWATGIDGQLQSTLDSFWRRRILMLGPIQRQRRCSTSPLIAMCILGIGLCAVPTLFAQQQETDDAAKETAGLVADARDGEAVAGNRRLHSISKRHGPWMILVTKRVVDTKREVTAAEKAGDALVAEFRKSGVPAYVVRREIIQGDRRFSEVLVLAGNYRSPGSDFARETLSWVRTFSPASEESRPYRSAYLTLNPLLSTAEAEQ